MNIFTGKIDVGPHGGMLLWHEGVPFPKKGFPYPEALWAVNIIKRQTMMLVMSFARKELLAPIGIFCLLPYSMKLSYIQNLLDRYCWNSDYILSNVYLKERYMTPCAKELMKMMDLFLVKIGISSETAHKTAKIFAHLVEYDDAYRYRIEDIFSETSKQELLDRPIHTMRKLIGLIKAREKEVGDKFIAFGNMAVLALLLPRFRKAFRSAVKHSEFELLQLDEADRYHVLVRTGYDFFGRSIDDRMKEFEAHHTRSACCDAKIVMETTQDGTLVVGHQCTKCSRPCGIVQTFPKIVEYQA